MTVSAQILSEQYAGNGVTVSFAYRFKIFDKSEVVVRTIVDATEVASSPLTEGLHYTVSGVGEDGGGEVLFTTAPASGITVDLRPLYALTQPSSFRNQGRFLPESHESSFDRRALTDQMLLRLVRRCLHLPDVGEDVAVLELPGRTARASMFLGFDANGEPTALSGTGADAGLRTDLAAQTSGADGSRLLGFRSTVSGAVGRSLYQKLTEIPLTAFDFGAVGDGVADDTAALQALVGYARAFGKPVRIPEGIYIVDINDAADVLEGGGNCVIEGEGMNLTEIRTTGVPSADRTLLLCAATESMTLRNLKLTGPSSDGAQHSKGVRHAGTSGELRIEHVWFHQWKDAVKKDAGADCVTHVHHCKFTNLRQTGVLNIADGGRLYASFCDFDTIGSSNLHHGFYLQAGTEAILSKCTGRNISGYLVHRFNGVTAGMRVQLIGCSGEDNTTGDLLLDDGGGYCRTQVIGGTYRSSTGALVWASHTSFTGVDFDCDTKGIDTTGGSAKHCAVSGGQWCNGSAGTGMCIELASSNNTHWNISSLEINQRVAGSADIIRIHGATDIALRALQLRLQGAFIRIRTGANRVSVRNCMATGTTGNTGMIYVVSTAADPCEIWIEENEILCSDRAASIEVDGVTFRRNRCSAGVLTISAAKNFRLFEDNDGLGILSPAQITAAQNDYNPTSLNQTEILRLTSDASRNVTGLAGGVAKRKLTIFNVGAQDIVLTNEDAASTAANRFAIGANVTVGAGESALLWYDSANSRWRIPGKHV